MGKKAVIKTKENSASVEDFLNAVDDEQKRQDSFEILKMMRSASKAEPKMWGTSLIGFGNLVVKSPNTGREVDWFKIGFSPRKANLTLYLSLNAAERSTFLKKLGKHKTEGGCIYVKRLSDVDLKVLNEMVVASVKNKK